MVNCDPQWTCRACRAACKAYLSLLAVTKDDDLRKALRLSTWLCKPFARIRVQVKLLPIQMRHLLSLLRLSTQRLEVLEIHFVYQKVVPTVFTCARLRVFHVTRLEVPASVVGDITIHCPALQELSIGELHNNDSLETTTAHLARLLEHGMSFVTRVHLRVSVTCGLFCSSLGARFCLRMLAGTNLQKLAMPFQPHMFWAPNVGVLHGALAGLVRLEDLSCLAFNDKVGVGFWAARSGNLASCLHSCTV